MTVRQAVAQAGGYDTVRFRIANPVLEQASLRSEYNSLWADYAKQRLRISVSRQFWPEPAYKGGSVYGKSNKHGEYPTSNAVRPEELAATIYHALGIPINNPQDVAASRPR